MKVYVVQEQISHDEYGETPEARCVCSTRELAEEAAVAYDCKVDDIWEVELDDFPRYPEDGTKPYSVWMNRFGAVSVIKLLPPGAKADGLFSFGGGVEVKFELYATAPFEAQHAALAKRKELMEAGEWLQLFGM